ncbi:hypothetical protein K227x_64840 [Rubripirellula lacrimiformis]|uniref:DUF4190 domain-containing protein n=1 Tax=Rubripirellula lacrimiformis TaxID=1930273 RepID=A0A517NLP4_9BACT|nr:DUF3299 domain-containing protein [Rubripirellula lacrimiformis]QDT08054.1 hypothetical protein K227x_64840 [Rubripirellula lacrimiformis]
MSAEIQMSSVVDQTSSYPYRAVSRSAIVSIILFVMALPGLLSAFVPMLGLSVIGIGAALVSLRSISRFPDEFGGKGLAVAGLSLNLVLLLGGISMHTYIYLTEVPDGYTRVQFYDLQQADGGPDQPTEAATTIHGQDIFLKGYIHPSSGSGLLKHFILVPDLGTCCFGGQPKSSDMIEITLSGGQTTKAGLTKKKLAGKFLVTPAPQQVTDFDNNIFYRMKVDQVR